MSDDNNNTLEEEKLGFDINKEIEESSQSHNELFTTANSAYSILRVTWVEEIAEGDNENYIFSSDPFEGVRDNGMIYINKEELGSLAQVMANSAEALISRKRRIESLEEHRNYQRDIIDTLNEENDRLRDRSIIRVVRDKLGV